MMELLEFHIIEFASYSAMASHMRKKLVCETDMMPSGLNLRVSIVFVLKSAPLTNKEDCWVADTNIYWPLQSGN